MPGGPTQASGRRCRAGRHRLVGADVGHGLALGLATWQRQRLSATGGWVRATLADRADEFVASRPGIGPRRRGKCLSETATSNPPQRISPKMVLISGKTGAKTKIRPKIGLISWFSCEISKIAKNKYHFRPYLRRKARNRENKYHFGARSIKWTRFPQWFSRPVGRWRVLLRTDPATCNLVRCGFVSGCRRIRCTSRSVAGLLPWF